MNNFKWLKEQFSRENHMVCNGKANLPKLKSLGSIFGCKLLSFLDTVGWGKLLSVEVFHYMLKCPLVVPRASKRYFFLYARLFLLYICPTTPFWTLDILTICVGNRQVSCSFVCNFAMLFHCLLEQLAAYNLDYLSSLYWLDCEEIVAFKSPNWELVWKICLASFNFGSCLLEFRNLETSHILVINVYLITCTGQLFSPA